MPPTKETVVYIPIPVSSGELPDISMRYMVELKDAGFDSCFWNGVSFGAGDDYVVKWYNPIPLSTLIEKETKVLVEALEGIIRSCDSTAPNMDSVIMDLKKQAVKGLKIYNKNS